MSFFKVVPKNWITPPNKLENTEKLKGSHFAVIQARQSIIFNGLALVLIQGGVVLASKQLKGRFTFPKSAALVHGLSHTVLYTALLDGYSMKKHRNFRVYPTKSFFPSKFCADLLMLLSAPYIAHMISKHWIKNPVSLRVSYLTGLLSSVAIYYMERDTTT